MPHNSVPLQRPQAQNVLTNAKDQLSLSDGLIVTLPYHVPGSGKVLNPARTIGLRSADLCELRQKSHDHRVPYRESFTFISFIPCVSDIVRFLVQPGSPFARGSPMHYIGRNLDLPQQVREQVRDHILSLRRCFPGTVPLQTCINEMLPCINIQRLLGRTSNSLEMDRS